MKRYLSKRAVTTIISWIFVLFNLGLIFYFSSKPATQSKELSGNIVEFVVDTVEKIAPNRAMVINTSKLHHLIRKNAHFFLYLLLGLLVINALRQIGIKSILIPLLFCVLYAISDEIHQIFVTGRSGETRDVLIDSLGASVGIIIYMGVGRMFKRFTDK